MPSPPAPSPTRIPPRIGLMLRAWGERGGVGVYTRNLVRELVVAEGDLDGADRSIDWVLLWRRTIDREDAESALDLSTIEQHVLRAPPLPLLGKLAWDQVAVPRAARRANLDAVLHPKFTAPFVAPCPVVMTVHGADWWDPDEARFYGRFDTAYIRAVMPWYFRRCAAVVSVSEQSTRGFVRALGPLAESRLRTVPFGPARHFAPVDDPARIVAVVERYGLPDRYLLTLAKPSAWERKNVDGLIRAYRRYAERVEAPLPLVVGGPEPERLRAALGIGADERGVVFPGWIDQGDLPAVHARAALFVYPSHLEAFPIPLAEALACGTPILTSTREGPSELVGDAARCVDPDDPQAVADALVELLADPAALAELSRRGLERSRHFSWPRAASAIRSLLLEVTTRDG